jgi:PAS domain S-box-containing protein
MNTEQQRNEWMENLLPGQFRQLFEHLPGTLFFVKDRAGHLMACNPAFIRHCGLHEERELLGHTDDELFTPRLAEKYRRDDLQVMTDAKPLHGIIELFPNREGKPEWFITDKLPLFDRKGRVCGVCGTVRSYEAQRAAMQPYLELAAVADHLKSRFREKLDLPALARIAGMSLRQFERKFRATFQITPRDYLIRMRVIAACGLLTRTNHSLTAIAQECGFYDHSDFARQFRRHMGQTASQYRAEHRKKATAPQL